MKITFLGAGSTIFAKNILGDVMLAESICESEIALFDIDEARLRESFDMLSIINKNINAGKARIVKYRSRKDALRGASFIVNAVQIGGYDPCTITDFEIPKKYGLRQTIADTIGIGGIFRALRTIPVMLDFARDIEEVCPDALLLNYANPMSMITGAMLRYTGVNTVGLCHSVQVCSRDLLKSLDLKTEDVSDKIAGINHMAWLLEIRDKDGNDLYPEIKKRALAKTGKHKDMVRFEIMKQFGYYVTESSIHKAEYVPYFIKSKYPRLIDRFNIPLDEYPRRCIKQIEDWEKQSKTFTEDTALSHTRTLEYGSRIIEAVVTNKPYKIAGNVINTGLITNLASKACVEVPCLIDSNGVTPCYVGELPEQLAALNRTNINPQLLTITAAVTLKKEYIYHAAMLDPNTSAELSIDDIKAMCDDLIEAHGSWLPKYA